MKSHLLTIVAALAFSACGNGQEKSPSSQIAAKVNKESITVPQLNYAMSALRFPSEEERKQASKPVLERLIDQELLAQKATEKKLDRDPRVMQALEASKRQILSQAYIEQLAAQGAKPTPEELRKFYTDHPELFAERRIYRLQEIAVGNTPTLTRTVLEEQILKAKSMADMVAWLREEKIPFQANSTTKAAEQLPMEILPRLAQLNDGQVMVMSGPQGHVLVQIASSDKLPLDEKQAAPFIEQFLQTQRKTVLTQNEVKSLRSGAKIEYLGEFAAPAGSGAAPAASPAPSPAKGTGAEKK